MLLVCRTLVVLCLLATITSTLRVYPHQLAYFNEAGGGPENGYKHLLHSNLDWGQGLLAHTEWMQRTKLSASHVCFTTYDDLSNTAFLIGNLTQKNEACSHCVVSPNKAFLKDKEFAGCSAKGNYTKIACTVFFWVSPQKIFAKIVLNLKCKLK